MFRVHPCRWGTAVCQRATLHTAASFCLAMSSSSSSLLFRGTNRLLAPKRGRAPASSRDVSAPTKRQTSNRRPPPPHSLVGQKNVRHPKSRRPNSTVNALSPMAPATLMGVNPVDVVCNVFQQHIPLDVFHALQRQLRELRQQHGGHEASLLEIPLVLSLAPHGAEASARYHVRMLPHVDTTGLRPEAPCDAHAVAQPLPDIAACPEQQDRTNLEASNNDEPSTADNAVDDGFDALLGHRTLSSALSSRSDARGVTIAKQPHTASSSFDRPGIVAPAHRPVSSTHTDDAAQVDALASTLRVFLATSHPDCTVGPPSFTAGWDNTVTAFVTLTRQAPPTKGAAAVPPQQHVVHGEAVGTTQREAFVDAISDVLFEASIVDIPPFLRSHMAAVSGSAAAKEDGEGNSEGGSDRDVFDGSIAGRLWAMLRRELALRPVSSTTTGHPMASPQLRIDGMVPTADVSVVQRAMTDTRAPIVLRMVAVAPGNDYAAECVELAIETVGDDIVPHSSLCAAYLRLLDAAILRVNASARAALHDLYQGSPCILSHVERRSPKRVLERASCHFMGHRRCIEVACTTGSLWAFEGTVRMTLPVSPAAAGITTGVTVGYTIEVAQAEGTTRKACRDAAVRAFMAPPDASTAQYPFPLEFHAQLALHTQSTVGTTAADMQGLFVGRPPFERGLLVQVRWMLQQVGDELLVVLKRCASPSVRGQQGHQAWRTQLFTKPLDAASTAWPTVPAVSVFEFRRSKSEHKALYQLAKSRFGDAVGAAFIEHFGPEYGVPSSVPAELAALLTDATVGDDAATLPLGMHAANANLLQAHGQCNAFRDVVPGFPYTCDDVRQSPSLLSTLRRALAEALEHEEVVASALAAVAPASLLAQSDSVGSNSMEPVTCLLKVREVVEGSQDALDLQTSYATTLEVWVSAASGSSSVSDSSDADASRLVCVLRTANGRHPSAWKATLCAMLDFVCCTTTHTAGTSDTAARDGGVDGHACAFMDCLRRHARAIAEELCEYCALPSPGACVHAAAVPAACDSQQPKSQTNSGAHRCSMPLHLCQANPLVSLAQAMMKLYGCRVEVDAKRTSRDDGLAHVALYATTPSGSSGIGPVGAYRDLIAEGRGVTIPEAGLAACTIAFDLFVGRVVPRDDADANRATTTVADPDVQTVLPVTMYYPTFDAASMAGAIAAAVLRCASANKTTQGGSVVPRVEQLRFGARYQRLPSTTGGATFHPFLELDVLAASTDEAAAPLSGGVADLERYSVAPANLHCVPSNMFEALEVLWQSLVCGDPDAAAAAAGGGVVVTHVPTNGNAQRPSAQDAVRLWFAVTGAVAPSDDARGGLLRSEIQAIVRRFQFPHVFQQTTPAMLMEAVAKKRYGLALVTQSRIVARTTDWDADVSLDVRVVQPQEAQNVPSQPSVGPPATLDSTEAPPALQLCQFILSAARGPSKKDALRACIVPLLREQLVTERQGAAASTTRRSILAGEHFVLPTTATNTTDNLAVRIVPLCR